MQQCVVEEGRVSSVDYKAGTVQVVFDDKSDIVSDDLPLFNSEYRMPDVGDVVVCLFLSNNPTQGFCLGTPQDSPQVTGKGIFYKDFFGEAFFKYDQSTGTLTINAPHVVINGKDFMTHTHSNAGGGQTGPVT
jgi:phage baseplate assembly protein gpV